MDNKDELIELYDRYCPICGKHIKKGSPLHHCSQKDLDKIDKKAQEVEEVEEKERTYDDKLKEFEDYNNIDFKEEEEDED